MLQFGSSAPTANMVATIQSTLRKHGLRGLIATDIKVTDILWRNIQTFMHGCRAGIAIFDRLESDGHNANVALEAGYMVALGKPVGFFKERTVSGLQSDLAGHIWYPFDIHKINTIAEAVENWLLADRIL